MKSFFQTDLIIVNNYELGGGKSCPSLSCYDVNAYTIP